MLEDDFTGIPRRATRGTGTSDADLAARRGLGGAEPADCAAGQRDPADRAAGRRAFGDDQARAIAHNLGLEPGKLRDDAGLAVNRIPQRMLGLVQ